MVLLRFQISKQLGVLHNEWAVQVKLPITELWTFEGVIEKTWGRISENFGGTEFPKFFPLKYMYGQCTLTLFRVTPTLKLHLYCRDINFYKQNRFN